MSEVKMLLLLRGENNGTTKVKFQPATFNMDSHEGKTLEPSEAGDFQAFVADAIDDMDTLASAYVLEHAKAIRDNDGGPTVAEMSEDQKHDLYVRLLASFSERPMELIGNMLAGMLVGCIEGMVGDPELDTLYADFVTGDSGAE